MFTTEDNVVETAFKIIDSHAFPKDDKQVFAFSHRMPNPAVEGWEVFIDLVEYERMGLSLQPEVLSALI